MNRNDLSRRQFVRGTVAAGALMTLPRWSAAGVRPLIAPTALVTRGTPGPVEMDIAIRRQLLRIAGGVGSGITLNDTIPGPLVELYEGHDAVLRVSNQLDTDSSIHWHGILLPFEMDGVPGVVFPGIKPGDTFEARFPVRQSGTYWYHSHSDIQEQSGHYGPLVVHPAEPEPFAYDRDYVVMLSDWTFEDPHQILAKLKKMPDYYNFRQRTVRSFFEDIATAGLGATLKDRLAWGNMRMSPTDISDVSAYTYTYLVNGVHPDGNWTAVFSPGERIRLRLINGSAMTYFNVRIPGLPMTVVAADGPLVQPVETDEIQIGVAETYDVIVAPGDGAYTLFAESMDRSGYARATLAPRAGMSAPVPALRQPPLRTMIDMGMDMNMGHGGMDDGGDTMAGMDHGGGSEMQMGDDMQPSHPGHMSASESMGGAAEKGVGSMMEDAGPIVARHDDDSHGVGNISTATIQRNRLGEPGTGLENVGHRVLVYTDLRSIDDRPEARRSPDRDVELHLTGNMDRYMWSFDGKKFSEVDGPIELSYGELIRLILVNDTMMEHPIHLHGMFMVLENGHGSRIPRKHTISVKPAERISLLINVDEPGRWAFHCHLLYHMEMGMFRVVQVNGGPEAPA